MKLTIALFIATGLLIYGIGTWIDSVAAGVSRAAAPILDIP